MSENAHMSSRIFDVSMRIQAGMQVYKNNPDKQPEFTVTADFPADGFHETRVHMDVHTGTHIDAPRHMVENGLTSETLSLEALIRPCTVFDLTHVEEVITAADIVPLDIQPGDFVLFKTRNSYEDQFDFHFVYVGADAAQALCDKGIAGVGVDGLGIERSQPGHPTHQKLFAAKAVIIEGLRLGQIEPGPYELLALPLALQGLDAAPARIALRSLSD